MKNTEALDEYLKPLNFLLDDPEISEISINQPGAGYIEKQWSIQEVSLPQLTSYWLEGLATLIARSTDQRLSNQEPLLSAILPQGHRIQIVLPPACEADKVTLSIRKQVVQDLSLDDFENMGTFHKTKAATICYFAKQKILNDEDQSLASLFTQQKYAAFLRAAIHHKKNILISGATGTGKTTFLNACLKEIPAPERIITVEDVREVQIPHPNKVHLIASKGDQGTAKVSMSQLIEACLRLRPDRIILGEMRGMEAADFLNATATGHDGSLSTIHASNPEMAFMRLVHMVKLKPGMNLSKEDILQDLHSLIDIVVQIKRVQQNGIYHRYLSEIYFKGRAN